MSNSAPPNPTDTERMRIVPASPQQEPEHPSIWQQIGFNVGLHPNGMVGIQVTSTFLCTSDAAEQLADLIRSAAVQSRSNLILPEAGPRPIIVPGTGG